MQCEKLEDIQKKKSSKPELTKKEEQTNWRALFAAIATVGAVGVAVGLGTQLVSTIMVTRGFSSATIGYSGTIGGVATVVAAGFASPLAKYLGVVTSILLMLLLGGISFIGFYFFSSIEIWFLLRFFLHFAMSILFILSEFWVNSSAPAKKRGLILSIYAIVLGLGFASGPTLLSFVGTMGFLPFGVGCTVIALAALPTVIAWKESPKFKEGTHASFLRYIFYVPSSTMAVFIYGAIQMGALTLISPFSLGLGYSEGEAANFMAFLALGNVLLLAPIGLISDWLGDKRYTLIGCACLGLIGTLLVPWIAYYKWLLVADLFLLGGVSAGLYTVGLAQLGARLRGSELSAANSAFIFCYGMGMLIGPTMIGTFMNHFIPFGFSAAMACFFAFYILLMIFRLTLILLRS